MKFSNEKTEESIFSSTEETVADTFVPVRTYSGNPEWDNMENASENIVQTGRNGRTYRNKDGSFTAVFERESSRFRDADGHFRESLPPKILTAR